ncbi:hypothetical protein [Haloarchaeobius sp. HME9146]|uniref:DUF7529 family protein n=1 Tax=Haloarchaeobius sp. HME9146 TaxID=2978732 RepID=UPI0021C24B4A|nr:hypothetical protein [Haloarchaeobius sp. HME9146]MCT9095227.1 hypothetical protein [Haloarchaeobius sp. HME9146]
MDESEDPKHVAERVLPVWERVVADMEATAEEYREAGWEALECHPGDIATITEGEGQTGLDVVLPDDEFDRIEAAYDADGDFDEVEAFRAVEQGIVFAVAALKNATTETALLVPIYYDADSSQEFLQMVSEEGELRIHLRPLDQRRILTFTQHEPAPFLPGGE